MKAQKLIIASVVCLFTTFSSFSQDKKEKPSPEKLFKRFDKNKDGSITKDELEGKKILEKFNKIDKDANESISLSELSKFIEKRNKPKGKKKTHKEGADHNHASSEE